MVFEVYLLKNGKHVGTERHDNHLFATRSGENWVLLDRRNTFRIISTAKSIEDLLKIY